VGLATLPATSALARPVASRDTTVLLQSQSGWVAPTGTFRINIRVAAPPGSKLVARLYSGVNSQAQLDRTGRGESLPSLLQSPVTVPLDSAPVVGGALDLSFPIVPSGTTPPPYGFQISREGVYPLGLTVLDDQGHEIGSLFTHLVRLPATDASSDRTPLTVALVVPVGAPVAHQPDGDAVLKDDQQTELEQLITTLGQTPSVPVTLTPTPETVSALSQGDLSNNTKVVASLASASRGRQVLTGPWVALDSGAWVGQGLTDAFGRELALGTSTLKNLLRFDPDTSTTTVDDSTSSDVLSALAAAGATQAVVPSGRLEPTTRSSSSSNPPALAQTFDLMSGNGDRLRAVAADDAMATRLVTGDDRVLAAHEVVASLSLLALSSAKGGCVLAADADQCSRGLALQLPASAAEAQIPLSVLLDAFADRTGTGTGPAGSGDGQAIVSPMTVDSLFKVVDPASESGRTAPSVPVQRRELTSVSPPSLGNYPSQLRATEGRVDGFRSMVVITDSAAPASATPPVTGGLDLVASLDQVTASSGSIDFDQQTRKDYLDSADARVDDQLAQITTEEQTIVTLTSRNGAIPLTINNGLDYPVQVRIALKSDKLEFPDGAVMDRVLLPPRVPTRVDVPVQARASGAFKLEATITSPDSGLVITRGQFNVRSTAVSGVGLVLTIAAGLFLLLWWGRHFRRTRRDKRLIASDHPSTRPAPAGAAARSATDRAPGGTATNGSGSPPEAISYAPADRD
ncbi:MAG: DUF6049 family protein, partial [Acidimicrobiales bacterium]